MVGDCKDFRTLPYPPLALGCPSSGQRCFVQYLSGTHFFYFISQGHNFFGLPRANDGVKELRTSWSWGFGTKTLGPVDISISTHCFGVSQRCFVQCVHPKQIQNAQQPCLPLPIQGFPRGCTLRRELFSSADKLKT